MSKNSVYAVTKNGRLISCVSSKTKAIGEMRDLAKAPQAEPVEHKDGLGLAGVLRFRARQVEVK